MEAITLRLEAISVQGPWPHVGARKVQSDQSGDPWIPLSAVKVRQSGSAQMTLGKKEHLLLIAVPSVTSSFWSGLKLLARACTQSLPATSMFYHANACQCSWF